MKLSLQHGFVALTIVLLISGCSISDLIKNSASESKFVLIVYADDTCKLTINGTELSHLKREVNIWGNPTSGSNYFDICSTEDDNENSIYISSMYPNITNPPLAYANLKSTVENYYLTEHMYFNKTMVFPITYQRKLFLTRPHPYSDIDEFAEIQMSILSPNWESLSYKKSYARGFSFTGFRLSAVQGEATFYGISEIAAHNILYKLVGTIRRTPG